jgi:diguanylate cyclase (GGDEF)-like protein
MEVRTSDIGEASTAAGGATSAPAIPHAPDPASKLRRRVQARLAPHLAATGKVAARRVLLLAYTAASITAGLTLLTWTTIAIPVRGTIDPQLHGTAVDGPAGGLLLWILFGFLGSLRVLRAPGGGGFLTFHLPFIGAAMVLGGPTAGAWVAFLSTLERRELEQLPWYGVLANHAVLVIGAVAGGLIAGLVAGLPGSPDGHGTGLLAAAVAGTLCLSLVSTGIAALTVSLRDELGARGLAELVAGQIGRMQALEIGLAWVFVMAWGQVGWWTPAAIGILVVILWDNHPMPAPDPLTGLLTAEGFSRRFEAGLGRLRRGLTDGATVLSVDLDDFKTVNDSHGHDVGNEVLAQVGVRLQAQARRPSDIAGRSGGDEFLLFLPNLADPGVAVRRAEEIAAAIRQPITTSVGPVILGASVGVVVIAAWAGCRHPGRCCATRTRPCTSPSAPAAVRTCSTPWSPGRSTTTGWRAAGRALATRRSPRRRTMG